MTQTVEQARALRLGSGEGLRVTAKQKDKPPDQWVRDHGRFASEHNPHDDPRWDRWSAQGLSHDEMVEILANEASRQNPDAGGDCYEVAGNEVTNHLHDDSFRLVHGTITGNAPPMQGKPIDHAWVEFEKDGQQMAVDNANGNHIELPVLAYYSVAGVRSTPKKYTANEAVNLLLVIGHYGPWTAEEERRARENPELEGRLAAIKTGKLEGVVDRATIEDKVDLPPGQWLRDHGRFTNEGHGLHRGDRVVVMIHGKPVEATIWTVGKTQVIVRIGNERRIVPLDSIGVHSGTHVDGDGDVLIGDLVTNEDPKSVSAKRHIRDLALLPNAMKKVLRDAGIKFDIGSTGLPGLDDMGYLRDVHPRGWPAGTTWNDAGGSYDGTRKTVFAGDIKKSGSVSMLLHETGHALDSALTPHPRSSQPDFLAFYKKLRPSLPSYFQQPPPAGQEELFAEATAMVLIDKAGAREAYGKEFVAFMTKLLHGK
jgi:hypothetical protein